MSTTGIKKRKVRRLVVEEDKCGECAYAYFEQGAIE